jgi:cysteine desulfurase
MTLPPPGLREGPILLDYNATTPVDPRVAEASLPYLTEHFGNPSSSHAYGQAAHTAVIAARASVAELVDAQADEIVFTGGGSDGDNLAIRGAALAYRDVGNHIITTSIEHPAVLATCEGLRRLHGFNVTHLPVDADGLVNPDHLEAAFTNDTVLVSIMHANNETGTIQPIRTLAHITHAHGALFHTDASQTAGKIPVSVRKLHVDLLTITGHKMYAPKGIGALYLRAGLTLEPTIYGGGQERGLRGGTENVALIVALGRAAQVALDNQPAEEQRLQQLRDLLHDQLQRRLGDRVRLNGHPTLRLPNTLNISIDDTSATDLLAAATGIAASTGSACHEGDTQPSPVLTAMGITPERAASALRLSIGRWTTTEGVNEAADLIARATASPRLYAA